MTVTAFAFPVAEPVESEVLTESSLVREVVSALEVPVPSILAVTTVALPVPSTEVEVEVSPGTLPNKSSTAVLEKQPTCTPVVVFNGMAAHTSSPEPPQPATCHVPDVKQKAYLASMHAYEPCVHVEAAVRLANSALRFLAWATLAEYWEVETVLPVERVEVGA